MLLYKYIYNIIRINYMKDVLFNFTQLSNYCKNQV